MRAILPAVLLTLAGCALSQTELDGTGGPPSPSLTSILHLDPEYYGKKKDSYGPLSIYQDSETHAPVTPPSCNPNARNNADIAEFSRRLVGGAFSPTQSAFKPDDPIAEEELQHNFLIPGDPGGRPPVAILDRSSAGIVFWHASDLVTLPEVSYAAKEFCSRKKRKAVYEGSSRKCSEPKETFVAVNGEHKIVETYAISSFKCI
jgi:hypothetical protein